MANHIFQEIKDNLHEVIKRKTILGKALWHQFLRIHPADIARFFVDIDRRSFRALFLNLPKKTKLDVFIELTDTMRVEALSFLDNHDKVALLNIVPADELTDIFDLLSDGELKTYLNLLHKKAREKVLSLMKFHPESAGGIMDTQVLSLIEDFTVEKSTKLLQRLKPKLEIHRQIYVTDRAQRLVGHINLEDLVLHDPKDRISSFMQTYELVAMVDEDRESVAKKMVHYGLTNVPVVSKDNFFLGVIPSETLVDVIVEEASEDVQKMSALTPMKYPYFETSFTRLLFERSYILILLLLTESISGTIMRAYETTLGVLLMSFVPMLISAGGNTSSQTSTMVIQGMTSGDIRRSNIRRFLHREFIMAVMLAIILGLTAFVRVYYTSKTFLTSFAVSTSLGLIVMASVTLGSSIPFILKRFNIDPAFSAGPFLATLMDILGILIYCFITKLILAR